jgi:hypothetical protein
MANTTTANDIISRVRISEVWLALGGGELRHGRGRAFWRNGDGYSVSVDDNKGCWHDFRDNAGGGVLDLIQHVLGGSRKDALRWLAGFAGISLTERRLTSEEWRAYQRERAAAGREARELTRWREGLIRTLEDARTDYLRAVHRARRLIQRHGLDSDLGQLAADVADSYEPRYQELDVRLDRLRKASFAELLPYFRAGCREMAA